MQWNKVGKRELTPYDKFFNEFPFGLLVILVVFSAKPGTCLLRAAGCWTRSRSAVTCMTSPSYLWCLLLSAWGCNLVRDGKEWGRLRAAWQGGGRCLQGRAWAPWGGGRSSWDKELCGSLGSEGGLVFPCQRSENLQPVMESRIYTCTFIFCVWTINKVLKPKTKGFSRHR